MPPQSAAIGNAWPDDWPAEVGKTVTLEGRAGNAKHGALLLVDGNSVWIDGMDAWPEELMNGAAEGVRLRVTGKVISRDDVPVFVARPGEVVPQGVPVASEEEAKKHKRRFLLAETTWIVLE